MTCSICGREFNPNRPYQKYCKPECRKQAARILHKRRELAQIGFEIDWAAWKRDFALGKTLSNLEATA